MAINKIIMFGETKLDISQDTVTPDKVAHGITFHDNSGEAQVGISRFDADTSDGTALPSEILEGKIAYVSGEKKVGTMTNNGGVAGEISDVDDEFSIVSGYHDGSGIVKISDAEKLKIISENIKAGVSLLGVTGNFSGSGTITAQAKNVTPSSVLQTVVPDAGYDYLSQVTVDPIPYTEIANGTGITLSIG